MKAFLLLLSAALLISCGASKSDQITLKWATDNNPVRQRQIRQFEKLNPGIKVEMMQGVGGRNEIILTQLASGRPSFDLLDVHYPNLLRELINRGTLMDLTARFKEAGLDPKMFWPQAMDYIALNDKVYAVPANAGSLVLWYNKKHFREAGLNDITTRLTWSELKAISEKLMKKDAKTGRTTRYGFNYTAWIMDPILMWQSGGELMNMKQRTIGFDNPVFRKTYKMFHDMRFTEPKSMPDPSAVESLQKAGDWAGGSLFASGSVSMDVGGRWMIAEYRKYPELEYDIAPLPSIEKNKPVNLFLTRGVVIPKDCAHPEEAWKFLQYMMGDAYNQTILDSGDGVPAITEWMKRDEFLKSSRDGEKKNYIYIDEMTSSRPRDIYEKFDQEKYQSAALQPAMDLYLWDGAITLDEMFAKIYKSTPEYFIQ